MPPTTGTVHEIPRVDDEAREKLHNALRELFDRAETIRENQGIAAEALRHLARLTRDLGRDYWRGEDIADADEVFDVAEIIRRLAKLPEHRHLAGFPVDVVWRRCAGRSCGRIVAGKGGAVGKRERELGAGWFRITLALDVWLLLTEQERERLVHHELGHCAVGVDARGHPKPETRAHDIEDFAATLARYGLAGDRESAQAAAAAASHPETEATWRRYGFDPVSRQGLLFDVEDAVVALADAAGPGGRVTITGPDGKTADVTQAARKIQRKRGAGA